MKFMKNFQVNKYLNIKTRSNCEQFSRETLIYVPCYGGLHKPHHLNY